MVHAIYAAGGHIMTTAPTRKTHHLSIPVKASDIAMLKPGDIVYLEGVVYTAREGVYDRVLEKQQPLPAFDQSGTDLSAISNVNFHCSPAAAPSEDGNYKIGGVTATASFRFSKWMERWLDLTDTKIVIGKGGMPKEDYTNILAPRGAVYLTTVGYGTGALLGRGVTSVKNVFWLDDLGIAQAMWMFNVKAFGPFIVDSDIAGNSLFAEHNAAIAENISALYDGLKPPGFKSIW
jgi:L(+)-tartrate dehydratase beta subunit